MPRVTVIMAHYNTAVFVAGAARSILKQTFRDLELIIIDDASEGWEWLDALGSFAKDARMKIYRSATNEGNYALKSQALYMSDSALIAFQDADDLSAPDRLARQVDALGRHRIDILGTSFAYIDAAGRVTRERTMPWHAGFALRCGRSFAMLHPTQMIRRDAFERLGGFDCNLRIAGDHDFLLRASLDHRLGNLPEVLYYYRVHPGALTQAPQTGYNSTERKAVVKGILSRHRMRRLHRPFFGPSVARVVTRQVALEQVSQEISVAPLEKS